MMLERGSVASCCLELFIDEPVRSVIRGVATTHQQELIQQYRAYIRMNSSFEDEKTSDGIAMEPSNTITTDLIFEPAPGMSEIPISDESIAALDGTNGDMALFAFEWLAETRAGQFGDYLFITQGGFIGKGPAKRKKEDQVCILLGSNVPLLLRRLDGPEDSWHLVEEICNCLTSRLMQDSSRS
jgi:hypothetical protein